MSGEARQAHGRQDQELNQFGVLHTLSVFVLYVGMVFLLGAVLAYPLFALLQAAGVTDIPVQKVTSRVCKFSAVVGLWPLLKMYGINTRSSWGFDCTLRKGLRQCLAGFAVGVLSMLFVAVLLFALDLRMFSSPAPTSSEVAKMLLSAVVSGLFVALIEELWFRGALYGLLAHRGGVALAIALTSLLYGLVHFMRPDLSVPDDQATWASGFHVVANFFNQYGSARIVGPLFALTTAGVLLALVRQRTGSIAVCVGLHAGWVVVIKSVNKTSYLNPESSWTVLASGYDGVTSYLAFVFLSGLCIAYYLVGVANTRRTTAPGR